VSWTLNPDFQGDVAHNEIYPKLSQQIWEILGKYQGRIWTYPELYKEVEKQVGKKTKVGIRSVVKNFEKQGCLKKEGVLNPESHKTSVIISLSPDKIEAISELLDIMENFRCNPSFRKQGSRLAEGIIENESSVCELLEKARRGSPNANQKSREEVSNNLLNLLDEPKDSRTIYEEYYDTYKRNLSLSYLQFRLRELIREGLVETVGGTTSRGREGKLYRKKGG